MFLLIACDDQHVHVDHLGIFSEPEKAMKVADLYLTDEDSGIDSFEVIEFKVDSWPTVISERYARKDDHVWRIRPKPTREFNCIV